MKKFKVRTDEFGDKFVDVKFQMNIPVYLGDEDDIEKDFLSPEEVSDYLYEMERIDLGEMVLNTVLPMLEP